MSSTLDAMQIPRSIGRSCQARVDAPQDLRHPGLVERSAIGTEERTALVATLALALTAAGAFLPWARIGGRHRSGFSTADTFISLADGAMPDAVAWIGRWWYAPAVLAFAAWATVFVNGHRVTRVIGTVLVAVSLVMWWLFVWAGANWQVLDVRLRGPVTASIGLGLLAWCCSRPRASLLRSAAAPVFDRAAGPT